MGDSARPENAASFIAVDQMVSVLKAGSRLTGRSDIQSLTDVLEKLDGFLKDADAVSVEEVMRESVESWLEQTKGAEAEENCILKLSQILQEGRLVEFLSKATERFNTLSLSCNSASEVLASPLSIKESGQTNDITEQGGASQASIVERYVRNHICSLIEEYVDSAANELMPWFTKGESWRSVISLVGPSGIGKTLLANKLYETNLATRNFDCCAWISDSESYKKKEVLKFMINQITHEEEHDIERLEKMRMMELIGTLRQSLALKRYLIVFDNVVHEEFWQYVKYSLPNNGKGSRIIVTTCSDAVVASCKEISFDRVHKVEPFSEEMSWELFCRIAFKDEPELCCPPELEKPSREFIRMCKGFPIKIVSIAGVLSMKERTVSEWKIEQDYLNLEAKSKTNAIGALEVLAPSFSDLPEHLRLCFLCFSIFPKDSLIPKDKVFKLWMAEGLVEEKSEKTLEEVSQEYLDELIRRNLVQACQGFYGSDKFCQVNRFREIHFCLSLPKRNLRLGIKSRHLSIRNYMDNVLKTVDANLLRSVSFFNIGTLNSSVLVKFFIKYRLLTFLDLECVLIEKLPEELGNLSRLKYLSLKNTKVRMLPNSLDKLHNLETLDLRDTLLIDPPIMINKLKNLRHLLGSVYDSTIGSDSICGVRINEGFGCLENLHSLMIVEAHYLGIGLVKELAKLQQLRSLGISKLTAEIAHGLCICIDQMSCLESLSLQSIDRQEVLHLQSVSSPPLFLKELVLKGRLEEIPDWVLRLENLRSLCLSLSRLTVDPLKHLSHLPNLESLWLYQAYEGERLHFKEGGFQTLKLLVLSGLNEVQVIQLDRDALPLLEELRIGPAPLLTQVPSGIYYLRNLKVLAKYDMAREFVQSMQPVGGSEYWKVEHIPSVLFRYKVKGKSYVSYNLGDSDLLNYLKGLVTKTSIDTQHQYEHQLNFCHNDDKDDNDSVGEIFLHHNDDSNDDFGNLSFSSAQSIVTRSFSGAQSIVTRTSLSSNFYTDDLED